MAYVEESPVEQGVKQRILGKGGTCELCNQIRASSYLIEPPDADPHVRWCGRGVFPPYPDLGGVVGRGWDFKRELMG